MPRAARPVNLAFAALGVFWGAWAALVPAFQTHIGASKGALGLALLGVGLGVLPSMLVVGRLIDRGVPRVLPVSLVWFAVAALLLPAADSVPGLFGLLVFAGAASGAVDVSMNAEAAALEAESGARLMQLAHGLYSVGIIAGAVAGGLLRQAAASRFAVFALVAAMQLVSAVATRNVRARPLRRSERLQRGRALHGPLLILGLAGACAFAIEGAIENWSALYLQRDLGAEAAASASGPAAYATAMAAGRLLGHRVHLPGRLLLSAGGAVAAVALAIAATTHSVPVAAAAFFAAGAGVSVAAPTLFGAAGREGAAALSTVTTVGYLSFVVGPPVVGGIAQTAGLRGSFALLAAVAALLALAARRLPLLD